MEGKRVSGGIKRVNFKDANRIVHFGYNPPSMNQAEEYFISVDVETAGPNPGLYSLLAIGACTLDQPQQTFYVELQPVNDRLQAEATAVHALNLEHLAANGLPPQDAMQRFAGWVQKVVPEGARPVCGLTPRRLDGVRLLLPLPGV
jgi:DNA polymerase III epsilon subunit-like protein